MNKDNLFPQFRKLSNEKAFYKIIDELNFEEIQLVGSKKLIYKTYAEQYPEILRIQDMLNCIDSLFIIISEKEWSELNN
jgi:hypothetical protein